MSSRAIFILGIIIGILDGLIISLAIVAAFLHERKKKEMP